MSVRNGSNSNFDYHADPILAGVLAYWARKSGDRSMPRRRDIDPIELRGLLPHVQLIDVIDHGARFRYRLAGTNLVAAFGKEYTGKYLDELYTGKRLLVAEQVFQRICDNRKPLFVRSQYHTTKDIGMTANRLYLPLSDNEREVNMILGSLTFEYGTGAYPGVFGSATLDAARTVIEVVVPALQD